MSDDRRAAGHRSRTGSPSAAEAAARAWSRLADLARASLATQASLTRKSVDLVWATVVGDLDRTSANRAYVESVTRESTRYWRTVGELGFQYSNDLVTLGRSVTTTALREVTTAGRKARIRHTAGPSASSASGSTANGEPTTEPTAGPTESTRPRLR